MAENNERHTEEGFDANLELARQTAQVAHGIVIKLKEMGLPEAMDKELASLSTDLGDLWSAQRSLTENVDGLLKGHDDWEGLGDRLADIRAHADHMAWHLKSLRRPLTSITRFAYRSATTSRAAVSAPGRR